MSLTDGILSRHGMKFLSNPYRIINKHGVIVQKQHLDLRESVLKGQENLGISRDLFVKTSPSTLDK